MNTHLRHHPLLKLLVPVLLVTLGLPPAGMTVQAQELINISTRGQVGTGADVMIAGFIVGGTANKDVLIRALGPTLGQPPFNLSGVLADPLVQVFDGGGTLIDTCDNWQTCTGAGQIAAGLEPPDSFEPGIVLNLAPGNYTAIVSGVGGTTGVGLVEVYDNIAFGGGGGGAFSVSGTIQAPAGTAMDSDVNDPFAPFAANDSPATAQPIPSPVALGGYCNVANAGEDGRSFASGDLFDAFRVSLPVGATATLFISDGDGTDNDLDLLLFDAADPSTPVDSSLSTTTTEQVTAPSTGMFDVVVTPFAGASNYVLIIGQSPTAASQYSLRLHDDFVEGEIIVRFKDEVLPKSGIDSLEARAADIGLKAKAGGAAREMLFELGRDEQREKALRDLGVDQVKARFGPWLQAKTPVMRRLDTLLAIKSLRHRADVKTADPNYMRYPSATPNDEFYGFQWHYPLINLPQAWDTTTGSASTVVAVIDTGSLVNHPDLQPSLLSGPGSGYDFISLTQISNDGDGIDANYDDPGDLSSGGSSSFHGTHVAGTIAGATNNTTGVAGVNWQAKIMTLRVLGVGGGTSYDILQGVRYAAGLPNDSPDTPAPTAVMNLSLGGGGASQAEQDVYTLARSQGTIIVAAAGNESTSQLSYPASYDGVVSVSAVDLQKNLAPYSNFGTAIDVAAPGGDTSQDLNGDGYVDGVLSTLGDDSGAGIQFNYVFYDGTSMASPHMAGVVSLMKAVNPGLTPLDLDTLLAAGSITEDRGATGRDDQYGHGLIDALKAVVAAGGTAPTDPLLVVNPAALNFGLAGTGASLSVTNAGGGTLTVNTPTDDGAWLTVSPTSVDGNGVGTYTATVDRTGLADGSYAATITFTSNGGTVLVPVVMQVGAGAGGGGDAGYQYVLLIDPSDLSTVAQVSLAPTDGSYDYTFTDVPSGSYVIVAGTDSDNDNFICDTGEACGGFPLVNELAEVVVSGDLSGLDFTTGFEVNLGGSGAGSTVHLVPTTGFRVTKRNQ